jgi:hypothetical protein
MYITSVTSYLGGWQILREQKAPELNEIHSLLLGVTAEDLRGNLLLDYNNENYRRPLDAVYLQRSGDQVFEDAGWENRRVKSQSRNGLGVSVRRWKNGVGIRFFAYESIGLGNFANWVMVDVPRANDLHVCDVSVFIVPMQEVRDVLEDMKNARLN